MNEFNFVKECIVPLLSALIGVFGTVLCTSYREYKKELEKENAYISALIGELKTLIRLFEVRENEFEESNSSNIFNYNFFYYEINYNYISVYEASCEKIGMINDSQVIERIIGTYIDIKAFYEQLKILQRIAYEGQQCQLESDCSKTADIFTNNIRLRLTKIVKEHDFYSHYIKNGLYPETKKVIIDTIVILENYQKLIEVRKSILNYLKTFC